MTPDRNRLRLLVLAGGAVGSLLRVGTTEFVFPSSPLPWGTLVVNVAGSLGLGYLIGRSLARRGTNQRMAFIGVGVMGALTTFGGVMVQVLSLIEQDDFGLAVGYLALSLVLGFGAAMLTLRTAAER